ncbi:MAG: KH domain-containing protein [Thermoplasmata archaeon]|nr:KH domain-containing protein [Thermoplasmata archaeon]
MPTLFVRIPEDRIGVVIGPGGRTKRDLERRTGTHIGIDPSDGAVTIEAPDDRDPLGVMIGRDIVLAIGRGFSPERADRLFKPDTYLGVIDIKRVTGRREKAQMWRIRSRLIGSGGKARTRIEDLSGCSMSIYGNTVALIGQEQQLVQATRAVEMLLRGSEHSVVFHMLARLRDNAALATAMEPSELPDPE